MGGGGAKSDNESGKDLSKIAKDFFKETGPLRREMESQFLEALTTGGVDARMPVIAKAEEQSRRATSNSLRQTETQLAQGGLAGTPFGANIRADTLQSGQQATAAIGPNIIAALLQQIPGFVTGANQTIVSGLSGAAGAEAQSQGAGAAGLGSIMNMFKFSKSF